MKINQTWNRPVYGTILCTKLPFLKVVGGGGGGEVECWGQRNFLCSIALPSSVVLAVLRCKGFFGLESSSSFTCWQTNSSFKLSMPATFLFSSETYAVNSMLKGLILPWLVHLLSTVVVDTALTASLPLEVLCCVAPEPRSSVGYASTPLTNVFRAA